MRAGPLMAPRRTRNIRFARCPKFTAGFAGRAVAALSADAAVSRRPSGLDLDGLALAFRRAGVAAIGSISTRRLAPAAAVHWSWSRRTPRFCSHHGIDWDAVREVIDDAEEGEVARGGSTITQQVAKNLFLWPGRSVIRKVLEFPLALWIDLVLPKRRDPGNLSQCRRMGPYGQFGARRARPCLRPLGFAACRRARRRCWPRSCPIRSGAAPATQAPGCGVSPGSTSPGHKLRTCSIAGAKIADFEPFGRILNLALRQSILYKRGLIGISACAQAHRQSATRTMPPTTPLEDTDMAVPRERHRPRGEACAARRMH